MTDIVERPEDHDRMMVTCDVCTRSGFANHPDSGYVCYKCDGKGAIEYVPADTITALRADLAEAQRLLENARQIERNVQEAREHEFKRAETAEAALRSQRAEVLREARAACDEVWAALMEKADRLYEVDDSTSLANSLSASNKASGAKLCSEAISALIDAPKEHG